VKYISQPLLNMPTTIFNQLNIGAIFDWLETYDLVKVSNDMAVTEDGLTCYKFYGPEAIWDSGENSFKHIIQFQAEQHRRLDKLVNIG
jgi:hypothetical protein